MSAWISVLALGFVGCQASSGPWDLSALEDPALRATLLDPASTMRGLSQLTPYPQLVGDGLALVTCRFEGEPPVIHLSTSLEGEPLDWAERVVLALDESLPFLSFAWVPEAGDAADFEGIRILDAASQGATGSGPRGLGDTLATCAMSPSDVDSSPVSAALVGGEIRMRRSLQSVVETWVPVQPEEWAGAFAHEIGHGLGFPGHVRSGQSLLGIDQTVLRRAGRALLRGEPQAMPEIEGLYALPSGTQLGMRALSPATERWRAAIESRVGEDLAQRLSRAGDRHAEIEWVLKGGERLTLRFPAWKKQLATEKAIIGFPTRATRDLLRSGGRAP